jgi:hypothetical protein
MIGDMDDVRIYNRLLTPSELNILYRWRGQSNGVIGNSVANNDAARLVTDNGTSLLGGPIFISPAMSGKEGGWHLNVSGQAGQSYRVLVTGDLTQPMGEWKVLTNGTFGSGAATLVDTATNFQARFYRIVSP